MSLPGRFLPFLALPLLVLAGCATERHVARTRTGSGPEQATRTTIAPAEDDEAGAPATDAQHAWEWRQLALKDENKKIPIHAYLNANQERADKLARQPLSPSAVIAGLDPTHWVNRGPQNVGGRSRSVVIHPTSTNIMWAASVGGGVWKSTNGGTTWTPLADFMPNLAANALTIDPANASILYLGTGEGYFNGDALDGNGIFKTTDGGTTWNQLPGTSSWATVNRIAIAPGNSSRLLVATRYGGIQRSTDAGATWTTVRSAQGSFDVAFDPTNASKAVAQILDYDFGTSQWFQQAAFSTDGGATWNASTGALARINDFYARIELAYAPSSPSIVYANVGTNGGQIYKSTDGGQSYALVSAAGQTTGGSWYNDPIWVSPTDPNLIVAGGVHLFRSTNGGVNLTQISNGYILTDQPHPDQHCIVQDPGYNGTTNKKVYTCSDGGVFRTTDITTASQSAGWVNLNASYQTTQYYGGAGNGLTQRILGGTQDNGTLSAATAVLNGTMMFGGDGGFVAIDPDNDKYCYGEYVTLQIHRSTDFCQTSSYITTGLGDAGSNANFIAPFVLDPNNNNRLLAGGASLWVSNNVRDAATPTWAVMKTADTDKIAAIAVAPSNSAITWVAQNDGKVFKTTNGTAGTPTWTVVDDNGATNPLPNRYPNRIVIDRVDPNVVWVAFGGFSTGNLMKTTDGGTTWSVLTGSGAGTLPAVPIRGFAQHPCTRNWLYAGTEVGIYASSDGGASWATSNMGPANVSVDELAFMRHSNLLVAATHGRGLWTNDVGAGGTDTDGDGIADACDNCPAVANQAQVDADLDGRGATCDCNDASATVWTTPAETSNLRIAQDRKTISWAATSDPGGTASATSDLLRSDLVSDFNTHATCLLTNSAALSTTDTSNPAAKKYFAYLSRGRNSCGAGTLGNNSSGVQRTGRACP